MDYKEKLRLAKEALDSGSYDKETILYIFPELAESEDEKIRKWLIHYFKEVCDNVSEKEKKGILSWIEKQDKKKPVQEIEPTPIFRIGDILKRKGKDYTFRVDRIQGGYYHCDRNHGAFFPIEEQGNWELVEQKPAEDRYMEGYLNGVNDTLKPAAWSEEDDKVTKWVIDYIGKCPNESFDFYGGVGKEAVLSWLNKLKDIKLKDILQLQPKQEWSEEDESRMDNLCHFLEEYGNQYYGHLTLQGTISWLKSLRPQSHWKPTDEQMEYLAKAIAPLGDEGDCKTASILND